jgi:hypothetical protein
MDEYAHKLCDLVCHYGIQFEASSCRISKNYPGLKYLQTKDVDVFLLQIPQGILTTQSTSLFK